MICKICNEEMPNRQKLAYHLNHIHGINIKEYKLKYKPDKDDNLLECPICGKYNMKQLTQHITDIHKLTKDEFLKQYPNTKLWTDEISIRCSKAQSIGIETYRNNLINDPHYYDEVYKERSKKRDYNAIADKIRKTRKERGTDEKTSQRSKEMWKSVEYREKQIKAVEKRRLIGYSDKGLRNRGKKNYHILIDGTEYNMRSSWEVKFANFLYEQNIKFSYEPFAIKYEYEGFVRTYYPDFYIPSSNLIVEVKALRFCDDEKVLAKRDACITQGFNFMFVTENELKDLENLRF